MLFNIMMLGITLELFEAVAMIKNNNKKILFIRPQICPLSPKGDVDYAE